MTLAVSEIFTSLQAEGPFTGRYATFIRFLGCNLSCRWCDTPYTWKPGILDKGRQLQAEQVLYEVKAPLVVLTGGEPLLHQGKREFQDLMEYLTRKAVQFETNGTIAPLKAIESFTPHYCISPKMINSGCDEQTRTINPWFLDPSTAPARKDFKFVVQNQSDINEVEDFVEKYHIERDFVWLMPEGRTREEQLARIQVIGPLCVEAGFNFSPRVQLLVWDAKRGV